MEPKFIQTNYEIHDPLQWDLNCFNPHLLPIRVPLPMYSSKQHFIVMAYIS